MNAVGFTVESLSAGRALEKLRRGGVDLLYAAMPRKNALEVRIRAKDAEKAFAILQSSCYNIKNVTYYGWARQKRRLIRAAGLLLGTFVFFAAMIWCNGRVLRVDVVGNGAYLGQEVRAILAEEGVGRFSPMPSHTGSITAKILSLPRVEFCSLKGAGGILTVEIRCSNGAEPLRSEPLLSPAAGTVTELVVLRGTPLVEVGAHTHVGDPLVGNYTVTGETRRECLVVAKATVRVDVKREYALSEEEALAQAFLDFGELEEIHTEKTQLGCRVEAVSYRVAALNFG